MTDSEQHPYVELIAREARRPVFTDPDARARIMAAVHAEPALESRPRLWERLTAPRPLRLSPLVSTLLAASLVGIGVFSGALLNPVNNRDARPTSGGSTAPVAISQLPVSDTVVRFVFLAPAAAHVSIVGDFNGWDATKTPMVRVSNNGEWTVTLPLTEGRHLYSFVVDGSWSVDPRAPLAPDDGFGHANSVKLVRRGSAL